MPGALTVRFGDDEIEVLPERQYRIGRGSDADLVVPVPDVSRHHATLRCTDGWWLEDEHSANGTFVDGRRITAPERITATSVVHLGGLDSAAMLVFEPRELVPAAAEEGAGTVLKGSAPQPFRDRPAPPALAEGVVAITLGSAPDNDVVIDDINVSRHHARVVEAADGFLVEDLNSLNGTLLNAAPVQRGFMTDADVLTLGNSDFVRRRGRLVPASDGGGGRGLRVDGLDFALADGRRLIGGVALAAERGTLTAVIGPSGAGKSTLAGLLAGITVPTSGHVEFDGFDLQRDYRAVKTRVGLVPQDDVVHRQLLLRRALRYAADLRLPSGLPAAAKRQQVDKTIAQLGLERHATTRISALSGGQRKRASVAMELLTEPSLLILDEPTSGLDPALDRQVMRTLRELADGGRTVIVITHSVAYLDLCDQVLVLAPGGLTGFLGPADGIEAQFGTSDWADVFASLADDPAGAHARWSDTGSEDRSTRPTPRDESEHARTARSSSRIRQWLTITARQCAVMLADRGYLAFLLALPVILGLLPWIVSGDSGLTAVSAREPDHATEPTTVLALLIIGATFMGVAMSIRDLIGERAIFLRERAVGLAPGAYLLAKLTVFGLFSMLVAGIMTAVSTLVKTPPDHDLFGVGAPVLELYVPIALTTWVSASLGLLISALATSSEQVMPVLILVLMVQLVLHGGLLPLLDREVLDGLSRFVPARWGFAAGASGIDLQALLAPGRPVGSPPTKQDPLWAHTKAQWIKDMGVLAAFGVLLSVLAGIRLRTQRR